MNACCFGSFPRQQADSLPEVRRPSKTNFENIFANFSEIGGCALRTLPVLYFLADADVAQLVEHDLAKVGVAGSNPVVRSIVDSGRSFITVYGRPFSMKMHAWRRGQVVRQRPAKPSPPVRIRASPPKILQTPSGVFYLSAPKTQMRLDCCAMPSSTV